MFWLYKTILRKFGKISFKEETRPDVLYTFDFLCKAQGIDPRNFELIVFQKDGVVKDVVGFIWGFGRKRIIGTSELVTDHFGVLKHELNHYKMRHSLKVVVLRILSHIWPEAHFALDKIEREADGD